MVLLIQTLKKQGTKIGNIEISSPDMLNKLNPDIIIISTINEKPIYNCINKIYSNKESNYKIISGLFNPELDSNSLYRTKTIIREYSGFPSLLPIIAHYQHGWLVGFPFLETDYINAKQKGLMFVFNKRNQEEWKKQFDVKAIIIGAPFCHYRRMYNIEKDSKASGTLAFPAHLSTNKQIKTVFDKITYLENLFDLPEEYHPITICSYFNEFSDWQELKNKSKFNFNLVTSGHSWSDNFPANFYNILKKHKFVTSNNYGSHILYSIDFGLPFFFLGEPAKYCKNGEILEDVGYQELCNIKKKSLVITLLIQFLLN